MDVSHEQDAFFIASYISKIATGVNEYSPESTYLETIDIPPKWIDFKNYFIEERFFNTSIRSMIDHKTTIFSTHDFNSLENFILVHKENGLSHLVIDDNNRSNFLHDIFIHEEEYPYLIKQFDSKDEDNIYNVKIFKIDYDKFELLYDNIE
tara:strand:- start:184 stop:636 length:453 start_codon:yes stop_codon:yes gene_type:complete